MVDSTAMIGSCSVGSGVPTIYVAPGRYATQLNDDYLHQVALA